jgi:ecotin
LHSGLALLILGSATAGAQPPADDLKAFPPAQAGQQRLVIRVPAVADPDSLKVEVMVGRQVEVDCNRQRFMASVTREEAKGWGYDYYVVSELKGPAGTLMACPPGTPRQLQFVRAPLPMLEALRYNPRLPLVLYLPEGAEARYRIWHAGAEVRDAHAE